MRKAMNTETKTHRWDLLGTALCGATSGRFSTSGVPGRVTCPECVRLGKPQHREEALAQIERAVATQAVQS